MIAQISGNCVQIEDSKVVIDVNGVGYLINATGSVVHTARNNPQNITILTELVVRDDSMQLFGFISVVEREIFTKLTNIQGVGPKLAIAVLSHLSPEQIHTASELDDHKTFQVVPGVGAKVAKRLATELKGKLAAISDAEMSISTNSSDPAVASINNTHIEARDALIELGMTLSEAEQALKGIDAESTVDEKVKFALKNSMRVKM